MLAKQILHSVMCSVYVLSVWKAVEFYLKENFFSVTGSAFMSITVMA